MEADDTDVDAPIDSAANCSASSTGVPIIAGPQPDSGSRRWVLWTILAR